MLKDQTQKKTRTLLFPDSFRNHYILIWVGLFYLRPRLFYLRLVFVAYGTLVWSFLLTVENRFGLFYLRFPPSENWIWSFLLTVPPGQKLVLVFFTYGSPTVGKKRRTVSKKASTVSKKDASF